MWPIHVYDIYVNISGYHRSGVSFLIGIYLSEFMFKGWLHVPLPEISPG